MALISDGSGASGDGQGHTLTGLILPFAGYRLEMMTGTVFIHVHIVSRSTVCIVQRLTMQGLLHIHLPSSAGAESGHVAVAGVVDVADRHRHAVTAAGGILAFKDQVTVVQADMTHASTPHILILIDQIIFQTSQENVVDGYIRLVVSMIAGV